MNPTRRVTTYILGVVTLILFAALLSGCAKKETFTARAAVIEKDYDPPWIQFIPVSNGKTTTMTPIYHAAQYDLKVTYLVRVTEWRSTNRDFYDAAAIGDTVLVEVEK